MCIIQSQKQKENKNKCFAIFWESFFFLCVCFSVFFKERNFLSFFLWAFRETSLQLSEILHFL